MSRVNKVIIIGNLGQDPDVRFSADGTCFATLSVATDESYTDKRTNKKVEQTEWHRCVANARLAEICKDYLKKGSKVYIEGRLRTRKWQNQQGQDQYTTEIRVKEMQMLDGRNDNQAPQQQYAQPQQAPQQHAPQQRQPQQAPQQQYAPAGGDFDDDIPFMRIDSFI